MATPFKRICLRASRPPIQHIHQRQSTRPISATPPRRATQDEVADSAFLDSLTSQPGVKYTSTESPEDLRKINVNDMSSLALRELEQHRELREIVRLAAWEMPLLSKLSKPFEPPRKEHVLRWRYTTYLGETHPAARKVVVEFQPERLPRLNKEQRLKLLKLAGARYNPSTKTIKMSCESFETQAQNKRYLGDTIEKLLKSARNLTIETFSDIPLDTRQHTPKKVHKFPKSWIITPERQSQLEGKRRASMLEEGKKVEEDRLVIGVRAIEEARKIAAAKAAEEPVMVEARRSLPGGKTAKRESGQKRR